MKGIFSFQFLAYTVLLFILFHLPPLSSLENHWFASCGKSFNCGKITGITYPFWGNDRPKECGYPGFELQCDDQGNTIIQISNIKYLVVGINLEAQIMTVSRKDLAADWICQFNTTIDNSNIFEYASTLVNFTFNYVCPPWAPPPTGSLNCPINGMNYKNSFTIGGNEGDGACHATIIVPGRKEFRPGGTIGDLRALKELLEHGFDVRWKVDNSHCKECEKFGGRCGFDVGGKKFRCWCPDDQSSSSSNNTCTVATPAGTFYLFLLNFCISLSLIFIVYSVVI
ncbi:LEAF RUST 10 DISEASE-RESISTANCE LOCUS RECEPTOR-LIKE PROTEIN KINASE-like 2.8 [Lycium barbarum]|uniref:LEAF RUST 10 DISEASE-RESISTANCE LOCUS RECEPTOR-LIKE PROTEIN KINASE-like 2.8 n=1 Tax=Lycium barbarum TaxID=112863 RepID=UPI00293E4A74|nr:LEAF RUST 10 DISEASE-RESISTANCE LOCUS RECEPTOR-LIKE PROTEIN KINASE-like 2.8 [Lycium barbarum]